METASLANSADVQLYPQPADIEALRAPGKSHLWAGDGFSFHDLLDAINPLQHLPVVSTLYRKITGDGIGNVPRVVGDALFGGAIGLVTGLLGVAVKEETGKDIGEHALALVTGSEGAAPATAVAKAAPPAETAAAPPVAAAAPSAVAVAAASPNPAASGAIAQAEPVIAPITPGKGTAPIVAPDHAPIPLLTMASVRNGGPADPRAAFLAQNAALQAHAAPANASSGSNAPTGSNAPPARVFNSKPVPLEGVSVPQFRGLFQAKSASAVAAASAAAAPDGALPAPGLPADAAAGGIAAQMLDALDKYQRLQRDRLGAPRGNQLDTAQ